MSTISSISSSFSVIIVVLMIGLYVIDYNKFQDLKYKVFSIKIKLNEEKVFSILNQFEKKLE